LSGVSVTRVTSWMKVKLECARKKRMGVWVLKMDPC